MYIYVYIFTSIYGIFMYLKYILKYLPHICGIVTHRSSIYLPHNNQPAHSPLPSWWHVKHVYKSKIWNFGLINLSTIELQYNCINYNFRICSSISYQVINFLIRYLFKKRFIINRILASFICVYVCILFPRIFLFILLNNIQ